MVSVVIYRSSEGIHLPGPIPGKTHFHMTYDLGPETTLTVHCKSKNDDLGVQLVPPEGSYGFWFGPRFLGGTLLF
ncbi:hypothetical protein TIFTF001_011896 [Ficus carica]|uniref:S-protein homolog n=1 Tax=Ficus carica TaxID=3494 RepID=A0AA88D398_FICCA|nr:hypothetical protein TIFTF001_011896 [Ficus carica]